MTELQITNSVELTSTLRYAGGGTLSHLHSYALEAKWQRAYWQRYSTSAGSHTSAACPSGQGNTQIKLNMEQSTNAPCSTRRNNVPLSFVHTKSDMDRPGIEDGPSRWEALEICLRPSPYRAVNTLRLCHTNQSVNVVQGNNRCVFWDPHKTHKYTEHRIVEC
jgi:hypothetical protein